jgi:lysophospholipase L1-like esterase
LPVASSKNRLSAVVLVGALAAASCGGSPAPSPSPTPTPESPAILCPAAITVTSLTSLPMSVTYPAPVVTGGSVPVTVSCEPASGEVFPVGTSAVTCLARDALSRSASCRVDVTVLAPPRLGVSRILAFGDSITAGEINNESNGYTVRSVQTGLAYPEHLRALLAARYPSQRVARVDALRPYGTEPDCWYNPPLPSSDVGVINAGCPGEQATQGVNRIADKLTAYSPDVVILLEGVNDIDWYYSDGVRWGVGALQSMIKMAHGRGANVMVGTLLPQRLAAKRGYGAFLIEPFNSQLVPMANNERAIVVDLYADFASSDPTRTILIGSDGLHPSAQGQQEIARMFYEAIVANYETAATSVPTRYPTSPATRLSPAARPRR